MKKAIKNNPVLFSTPRIRANADGSYPEVIELCRVGDWHTAWHGDFQVTEEDMDEAISHFEAGVYRVNKTEPLPITIEHEATGATARIYGVFRIDQVLYANVKWTKLGEEKLDRDEYRYISFEFCPRSMPFVNPENAGDVLTNVIMGATMTNDPLFKTQKPIMASARGGGDNNKGESMNIAELRAKELKDLTPEELAFLKEHAADLTAEERTKFELGETEEEKKTREEVEEKARLEKQAADKKAADDKAAADKAEQERLEASTKGMSQEAKAMIATLQASVKTLQAKAEAGERAEKQLLKNELTATVTAHVKRGAIKSEELDSTVDMLMASTDAGRDAQLGFMEKLPSNELLAKATGSATVEASANITDAEREMAASFGLTEEQLKEHKASLAKEGK